MKILLVDDERLARNELRRLLSAHPDVQIVGEATSVDTAAEAAARVMPDLVFLDIKMPGGDGFELLERLDRDPAVIFTTAYDEYALRAFEVSAMDYLMKPVEPERLASALERVREHLQAVRARSGRALQEDGEDAASPLVPAARARLAADDRVFVRDGRRVWLVRLGDVVLFESEGNYTRLLFRRHRPLVHRSLRYLDARLDPAVFFRANRRQIVNLGAVRSLEPGQQGRMIAVLADGREVEMSRRRAQDFRDAWGL